MEHITVDSAYALTAASFLVILSRTLFRRLKHEKFQSDDYLMLASLIIYAMHTAVYPIAVYHGNNTSQTAPQKLTNKEVQNVILGSKFILLGRVFYMSYLWITKACILIYYTRLTSRMKELLAVKITAGLLALTWVVCMLVFFLECRPIQLYWQVLPSAPQCAKAIVEVIVMESTNIATDFLIMAIPLPIIFRTTLPLKTKIQISAVFLAGFFVIIVSILRMVIVIGDLTQRNKLIWAQIECFAATVVANAPIIHGLWRHGCGHIRQHKFGKNACPPEYNFAVRAATGSRENSEHELQETITTPTKSKRQDNSLRKSIKKINERMRRSFECLEIERSVELLQESKTGKMSDSPNPNSNDNPCGPPGMDLFLGKGYGSVAHISTEISHEGMMGGGHPSKNSRFGRSKR